MKSYDTHSVFSRLDQRPPAEKAVYWVTDVSVAFRATFHAATTPRASYGNVNLTPRLFHEERKTLLSAASEARKSYAESK